MKAWKALEIKDLIHKNKFWWKTKSISSFLLLKTVCKLKNQNWRQKNTSLCFILNSKIQILFSDWAQLYWLLPIGYSSFSPPFLPSKAFQFKFKNSNSGLWLPSTLLSDPLFSHSKPFSHWTKTSSGLQLCMLLVRRWEKPHTSSKKIV